MKWASFKALAPTKPFLLLLLAAQLLCAYTARWSLTTATLSSHVEYQLGQEVIASENWRREGALAGHFIPSRSVDQALPEWGYRDGYWRYYLSQPPLSFMLHYWASRIVDTADPILVGKLLAQAQIATGILVAGALLYNVFGFGATLTGLSFLIWGQPFLVWFIDGYFATTPAMVCQLVLVAWCLAFFVRELADPPAARSWPHRWRDLLIVWLVAYLGTLSEWVALLGNAVAVAAFLILGFGVQLARTRRAYKAYAIAFAIALGSAAAEATTIVLFSTKIGFDYYWAGFAQRIDERTGQGQGGLLAYTQVLIHQMETAWPALMLRVLAVLTLGVLAYGVVAVARNGPRSRRTDGIVLLLAMVLGFGGGVAYCYRLQELVEVHWWFTGTWAIGWAMVICGFTHVMRRLLQMIPSAKVADRAYFAICCVLCIGAIGWNASFVNLKAVTNSPMEIYRAIGEGLPHDGYPLIAVELPDLFAAFPFTTAYLRRPVIRSTPSDDPDQEDNLLTKLGTTEDATNDLLNRAGFERDVVYVAYDASQRSCAFEDMKLEGLRANVPVRVCRVRTRTFLHHPSSVWTWHRVRIRPPHASVAVKTVEIGSGAGTFGVPVSSPSDLKWSAASNAGDFITLKSPALNTGSGTATFGVERNPGFPRRSSVVVAGTAVGVNQAGLSGYERHAQTLLQGQVPLGQDNDDGYHWELGTRFVSDVPGKITTVWFWKATGESGPHVGRIWNADGRLLASVTFTHETSAGWQNELLPTPLNILANSEYLVSVPTGPNRRYAATPGLFASPLVNGHLKAIGSRAGTDVGSFPPRVNTTGYFRDVVFVPR